MYIQNRALFNSKSIVLAIKMAPFAKNNHASIGVPKCHYIPYETFMRRYTFGDEICCGGFCAVYAATRNLDNRPTAIKLVPNDTIYRWDLLHGRLVPIEVALLTKCQSIPGVIRMYHYTKGPQGFLIAMERMESGMDLFEFVTNKQHGPLSEGVARKFFRQIVETVQACAKIDVAHRDIKPENIIIDTETRLLKLIDFGSGAWLTKSPHEDFYGTPLYAPPEWYLYRRYDAISASVWSLGILLYVVLIGEYPFQNQCEIIRNSLEWGKNISFDCQSIILSCLASTPADRLSLEDILQHSWLAESDTDQWKLIDFTTTIVAADDLCQNLEKFIEDRHP